MGLATGLAIAGVGMQAMSQYRQGQAAEAEAKGQQQMSLYNAQVAEQNAQAIEAKTTFDQLRALKRGQNITGTLRAKLGASGALMDEGAPARLVAEQEFENALDVALTGYEGRMEASQQRSAANLYKTEAQTYKMRAKNAGRAGKIGAGTSILTGFSNMGEQGMFKGTPLDFWNV